MDAHRFPPIEEVHAMLDELAEALPREIFRDLNKGIILLPQVKYHPKSDPNRDLYVLGEYTANATGRQIILYYGSFAKSFPGISKERLFTRLRKTLHHEFIHHLEGLAGDFELELEDKRNLARYQAELRRDGN